MSKQTPWARAIRRRMTAWGLNQTDLAALLERRPQRVHDWLHGTEPSDAEKLHLMERLSIAPAEVMPDWLRDAEIHAVPPPTAEGAA